MADLLPGTSLSLYCVGDAAHPGARFLNGNTVSGGLSLESVTTEPFSGTRWFVIDGGFVIGEDDLMHRVVALQCLGDIAGNRYLNGHTNDASAGTADLAPTTSGVFTGTAWRVDDDGAGGVTLRCMGSDPNPSFQFLDGRTGDGSVGLAPRTDGVFTGTHWRPVDVVDDLTEPVGRPALTEFGVLAGNSKSPAGNAVLVWVRDDGHIYVQSGRYSADETVTMLVDQALDRPALVVHDSLLHLAFTAPDGSIHVMASDDGHVFDTVSVLNVGTRVGPGLASWNGHLILAWAAPDGALSVFDVANSNRADLLETSAFAPALIGVPAGNKHPDSLVHLAWTGTDQAQSLNTLRAVGDVLELRDDGNKQTLPDTSIAGPTLAWLDDLDYARTGGPSPDPDPVLVLGWTGRPAGPRGATYLNASFSASGTGPWGSKMTVDLVSSIGPSMTHSFNGTQDVLHTAWAHPGLLINTGGFFGQTPIPT